MTGKDRMSADFVLIAVFAMFVTGYALGAITMREVLHEKASCEKEVLQQTEQTGLSTTPIDSLSEWTTLQMAIVMTESQFDPEAVGAHEDWGIFQITEIYSKEANRVLKKDKYSHADAFDIGKSIEMFNTIQDYYNPLQDIDTAIKYHNSAPWYAKKVKRNILFIRRMEEVRKQLRERG